MIAEPAAMDRRALLVVASLAALPVSVGPAGEAWAEEKKKTGGGSYLQINTLNGTTFRANGARGVLSVDCGLDVPDPTLHKLADQSIPRLRAAYLQTIQAYAAGLQAGMLPNADYVAAALQRTTDQTLGRAGAKVLLGAIVVN
jgi:hypothetical protein